MTVAGIMLILCPAYSTPCTVWMVHTDYDHSHWFIKNPCVAITAHRIDDQSRVTNCTKLEDESLGSHSACDIAAGLMEAASVHETFSQQLERMEMLPHSDVCP